MMSDALLAQSAVDRLTSGAHTLIIEGPSYPQRDPLNQRATVDTKAIPAMLTDTSRWSHARGNGVVPSRWQSTLSRAELIEESLVPVNAVPPLPVGVVRHYVALRHAGSLLCEAGPAPRRSDRHRRRSSTQVRPVQATCPRADAPRWNPLLMRRSARTGRGADSVIAAVDRRH
jgi:hypothetical protein